MACNHCGTTINGGWLCDECHKQWVANENRHLHGTDCRERGKRTKNESVTLSDDLDELSVKEDRRSYGARLNEGFAASGNDERI